MAMIEVNCTGQRWQQDFEILLPRLQRYFGRCFRYERDHAEVVHNVVLLAMEDFRRRWQHGDRVRVSTRYVLLRARSGEQFGQTKGAARPRRLLPLQDGMPGLEARPNRAGAWVRYRLYADRLPSLERDILDWIVSGHTVYQVRRHFGVQHYEVERIVKRALQQLAD